MHIIISKRNMSAYLRDWRLDFIRDLIALGWDVKITAKHSK